MRFRKGKKLSRATALALVLGVVGVLRHGAARLRGVPTHHRRSRPCGAPAPGVR